MQRSYSLDLKGGYIVGYRIWVFNGDARSLDYSSYGLYGAYIGLRDPINGECN